MRRVAESQTKQEFEYSVRWGNNNVAITTSDENEALERAQTLVKGGQRGVRILVSLRESNL